MTCGDLKKKRPYKLLDLKITKENGFNGEYKLAVGKLQDKTKPKKELLVKLPKPVANYSKDQVKRILNPSFIVKNIKSQHRSDGKGTYDIEDFKWI